MEEWHLEKEKTLNKQLFQECRKEDEMWRLKSRSIWLKFGDQNTSFFHKKTKAREMKICVKEITPQGKSPITSFAKIKEEAHSHFQSLYSTNKEIEEKSKESFLTPFKSEILVEENLELIQEIKEEVMEVILALDPDKGPDQTASLSTFIAPFGLSSIKILSLIHI